MDLGLPYIIIIVTFLLLLGNIRYFLLVIRSIGSIYGALLALTLSFFWMMYQYHLPHSHALFGDEPLLLWSSIAQFGISEPLFLKIFFRAVFEVFGHSNLIAINVNIIMSIITLFLFFIMMFMLFEERKVALISVIFVGIYPPFIAQSVNSYTAMPALLLLLASSIFFWLSLKHGKLALSALSLLILMMAISIRLEYLIVVPIYAIFSIVINRKKFSFKKENRSYLMGTLILWTVLFSLFLGSIYLPLIKEKMAVWETMEHLSFTTSNIQSTFHGTFMAQILGIWYVLFYAFASIPAFIWIRQMKRWYEAMFLLCISLSFTAFYLLNSYFSPHHTLHIYSYSVFPLGIALVQLLDRGSRVLQGFMWTIILFICIGILGSAMSDLTNTKIHDHYYMTTHSPRIVHEYVGGDCLIMTPYAPNLAMAYHMNVLGLPSFMEMQGPSSLPNCTYFFEDYLCRIPKPLGNKEDCEFISSNFTLITTLIIIDRNFNQNFTLYELHHQNVSNIQGRPVVMRDITYNKTRLTGFFERAAT